MSLVVISTIFITCNQMSSPNGMTILPLSCLARSLSAFTLSCDGGILFKHQKFTIRWSSGHWGSRVTLPYGDWATISS